MRDVYRIKAFPMLGWWLVCSVIVFPLCVLALALIGFPSLFIISSLFGQIYQDSASYWLMTLIAIPLVGAIIGTVMAFLQVKILRTRLYWAATGWRRWTIIGGAAGAIAVVLVALLFEDSFFYYEENVLFMMPVFLAVVSVFQFIALREAVKQAWLWVIANIVGGMVFASIPLNNQVSYYNPNYGWFTIGLALFAVIAMGFITGFVLLFLFEKKLLPMRPETEDEAIDPNKPKSVWDKAI